MTILSFVKKYSTEAECIKALAYLKWPNGFVCKNCGHDHGWQLKSRPIVFECRQCNNQESVLVGTIFQKTRTPLTKWFYAAYMMINDKRGISATFLSKELKLRYETAWLMMHKLRNALYERKEFQLRDFVEVDETFYGGRRQKGNRGRSQKINKSMIVIAVEKKATTKDKGIKKSGYKAGNARVAVIPGASIEHLGNFIRTNVKTKTKIVSDGWRGYADLMEFKHMPTVQGSGKNAETVLPLVHILFSNIKAWLNGTFHGVSGKHLHRYLKEWNYRFNRRANQDDLFDYVLGRTMGNKTITFKELVERA
ncbi:MAG TPA: IS1595 family transposase [Dongiaceae bacterium]|jgi:transposase-like protein|nr:IS1595 family transposase [Dongiaceae bacterium]